MGLNNYSPERHEIPLGQTNSISVRGLSLPDISRLINCHLPDIEALFSLFATGMEQVGDDQFKALIMGIVKDAPGFAANLIALAADEPDEAEKAEMIPFPLKIKIIQEIAELTFVDVGGLKNGLESLMALLTNETAKKLVNKAKTKAR